MNTFQISLLCKRDGSMPSAAIYLSPSTRLLKREVLNSDILETEFILGTVCEENVCTNVKLPGT